MDDLLREFLTETSESLDTVDNQLVRFERLAGFHDYVAKFDRPGLIAALKEQTAELSRAA